MANTKVPSILWNVGQDLTKSNKETARSNIGISGLVAAATTHQFVTAITENSTTGNLSVSMAQPGTADISGLSTALSDIQDSVSNHKHYVKFNSDTAIELTANNSGSPTSLNHSHGAVTTDGKITESAVSAASSGVNILVTNSNNLVKKSDLAFDGSSTSSVLVKKGVFRQLGETDITNLSNDLSGLQTNIDNHTHYVKFNSENAIALTTNNTSGTAVSLNHSHGGITTSGTITATSQATDKTPANGDKLVLIDTSDTKVKRSSVSFDGTTTSAFLTKKGTWGSPIKHTYHSAGTPPVAVTDDISSMTISTYLGEYSVTLDGNTIGNIVPPVTAAHPGQSLNVSLVNGSYGWGNPYFTLYEPGNTSAYRPTPYAGAHLGDGFGYSTVLDRYNQYDVPMSVAVLESASVTASKIGIVNGSIGEQSPLYGYFNARKITDAAYLNALAGGEYRNGSYDTSYISSISATNTPSSTVICRIPPRHWGLVSLCISTELVDDTTPHTALVEFDCKMTTDDHYIDYTIGTLSVSHGAIVYADSAKGYANPSFIVHNYSDEVKTVKLAVNTIPGTTYQATVYKQYLIFKTPDEPGAFNQPDQTLYPPAPSP